MPSEGQRTKIALLIDADNASPRHADAIMAEVAKLGEAIVRRVYGDFGNQGLKGWTDRLSRHALVPMQSVAYVKGKNATDIMLAIDAMDLMHSGNYDAFCIVSSDSDFTRLAQRIRESGAEVYGFGEAKTPDAMRQSCRRFFLVENLARDQARAARQTEPELALPEDMGTSPASEAVPVITRAYEIHKGDFADGWVPIRHLQRSIANFQADFDVRSFGEQRLGDLAERTGVFEVRQIADRGWWLRKKDVSGHRRVVRRPRSSSPTPAPTPAPAKQPVSGLEATLARGVTNTAPAPVPARKKSVRRRSGAHSMGDA